MLHLTHPTKYPTILLSISIIHYPNRPCSTQELGWWDKTCNMQDCSIPGVKGKTIIRWKWSRQCLYCFNLIIIVYPLMCLSASCDANKSLLFEVIYGYNVSPTITGRTICSAIIVNISKAGSVELCNRNLEDQDSSYWTCPLLSYCHFITSRI